MGGHKTEFCIARLEQLREMEIEESERERERVCVSERE